jgi:hypothetical protein
MPYEGHSIEVVSKDAITLATVYDGDWFFAGNDLASLKKLLDRVDERAKEPGTTLSDDDNFKTAMKQMPANYAAICYARIDAYMQKLAARLMAEGMENEQASRLGQIRSVSAATSFANGKIRDVFFVAMPRMEESGELTRTSLALTTKDSFLYAANLLNFPNQITMPSPQTKPRGMPAALQQFVSAFSGNGITRDDFDGAFAHEVGVIGDWPEKSRLPGLLATLGVKDIAKARKILETLETGLPEADKWTTSQKDDVQYYSKLPSNPLVPVTPTIALSSRLLVAGLDRSSVESAIKRDASPGSSLTATANFKTAGSLVPAPRESFAFLDMALFYDRLDTTVRPMLVMAAAFMPAVNEAVDLGKLPAAEVITKHLSPMVASQSYQGEGYLTEMVGPVSVYQVALGLLAASNQSAPFFHGLAQRNSPDLAEESASPTAESPSPTPDGTQ